MIQKPIVTQNGPAACHVLKDIRITRPFAMLALTIDSYADESTFLAGGGLIVRHSLTMPSPTSEGRIDDDVEQWLIGDPSSPLQGGQIILDMSDTLDAAKERKWITIKAARAQAEVGTFRFDGGTYDIDKLHVTGAVVLATIAKSVGAPYSEGWTLADNSVRQLDADQVIGLGVALGECVSAIYQTARNLRTLIDEATSFEELERITWPLNSEGT